MSTTTGTARAGRNGQTQPGAAAGRALPTRQRHPKFAMLMGLLVIVGALVGAWLYLQAGRTYQAVQVTHRIPPGHTVTRSDVTIVPVAGEIHGIKGEHLQAQLGKTTKVGIVPGTLLQESMLTSAAPIGPGKARLAVSVTPGQSPPGLTAGDRVVVLGLPPKNSNAGKAPVLASTAQVFATGGDPSQTGGAVVTLNVSQQVAGKVAAADAANGVELVKVGRPGR
jgi:hypothetical protein